MRNILYTLIGWIILFMNRTSYWKHNPSADQEISTEHAIQRSISAFSTDRQSSLYSANDIPHSSSHLRDSW
jgi:hypothetical protein